MRAAAAADAAYQAIFDWPCAVCGKTYDSSNDIGLPIAVGAKRPYRAVCCYRCWLYARAEVNKLS
jgi:hypothetical protein